MIGGLSCLSFNSQIACWSETKNCTLSTCSEIGLSIAANKAAKYLCSKSGICGTLDLWYNSVRACCVLVHSCCGGAGYLIVPFQLLNSYLFLSYSSLSCSLVGTCSTICHASTCGPTACVILCSGCCVCCTAFVCSVWNSWLGVGVWL